MRHELPSCHLPWEVVLIYPLGVLSAILCAKSVFESSLGRAGSEEAFISVLDPHHAVEAEAKYPFAAE